MQTRLIIIAENVSKKLDQLLALFFSMNNDPDAEIVVIDHGTGANVRNTVEKFVTHGFIRYIKCMDDPRSKAREIAAKYGCLENALCLDINQSGFLWNVDCPAGPRENLEQIRIRLGKYFKRVANKPAQADPFPPESRLNILLVLPDGLDSKYGYQAALLARALLSQDVRCTIAVPSLIDEARETISTHSSFSDHSPPLFQGGLRIASYASLLASACSRTDSREDALPFFNVIHAWTPRENVRKACEKLQKMHGCPMIIHLTDNEEYLTQAMVGRDFHEMTRLGDEELNSIIPHDNVYHPVHGPKFLRQASGLTMTIETLSRFNSRNVPSLILPALVDERLFYPRPLNTDLRRELGILDSRMVLAYTGSVHEGNRDEVYELYKAVVQLNEQGCNAVLLRTGLDKDGMGVEKWDSRYVKHLGLVERAKVPEVLAAANILVQPGAPGPFNDERIPCKLPEYFAMGRPIILPRTNVGLLVENVKNAYIVQIADAHAIAKGVQSFLGNYVLNDGISNNSVDLQLFQFTQDNFQYHLIYYYQGIIGNIESSYTSFKKLTSSTILTTVHDHNIFHLLPLNVLEEFVDKDPSNYYLVYILAQKFLVSGHTQRAKQLFLRVSKSGYKCNKYALQIHHYLCRE